MAIILLAVGQDVYLLDNTTCSTVVRESRQNHDGSREGLQLLGGFYICSALLGQLLAERLFFCPPPHSMHTGLAAAFLRHDAKAEIGQ